MEKERRNESLKELEFQTERASLFTHTVLTNQIIRQNESEAFLFGLIDYLIKKEIVISDELLELVSKVKQEIVEKKEYARLGVAIRVDEENDSLQAVKVNCEEYLPICKAVCCRLGFALTTKEIESGLLKWELGKPYQNRRKTDGYCYHIVNDNKCCNIYTERPSVCRKYNCSSDKRIWKDYNKKELNVEWIESNLNADKIELVEMYVTKM
jgi:Fe-S-cluster containining protein